MYFPQTLTVPPPSSAAFVINAPAAAAPTTTVMSSLLSLPDDVLKLILLHVPVKDRISSCCLVHTRLRAAAVAATQHVHLGPTCVHPRGWHVAMWHSPVLPQHVQRAQSLLHWVYLYGQFLTRLQMSAPDSAQQLLRQLPCAHLLELRLEGCRLQLGPGADGSPGVAKSITKLTRLELETVRVADGPGVDSLSMLAHLRHLHWGVPRFDGHGWAIFSEATLPCLQHLTHLGGLLPPPNLAQLSTLTSLQELCLEADCNIYPVTNVTPSLSSVTSLLLPSSLTKLELVNRGNEEQPPADHAVEFALLASAPTALRALRFHWYSFPNWDLHLPMLSWLGRLQSLTQLVMHAWYFLEWPPPGPAYSALTASSSLESLQLAACLPYGVWQHVFGGAAHTVRLPHLTSLLFDEYWFSGRYESHFPPLLAFGPADVACMVRSCPQLCAISYMCLTPGLHMSELHKLTALTSVDAHFMDDASDDMSGTVYSLQGLAAVTQLKSLIVDLGRLGATFTTASLLPLVSLTALTRLRCSWWVDGEHKTPVDLETEPRRSLLPALKFFGLLHVLRVLQAGSAPDVWVQLEHCAAADPDHQPTALLMLAQQGAQPAAQQQQPAAQHAVAVEQAAAPAAGIAALVGQLQELLVAVLLQG